MKIKRLLLMLLVLNFAVPSMASDNLPFAGRTKHKTVKRMKKRQVRKVQKKGNFYYRANGKLKKRR